MLQTKMKKSAWLLKYSPYGNNNNIQIFNLNYGVNNIGRSKINSIILENETISRYHCRLVIENNDIPIISDIGSKNGTIVHKLKLEGIEGCILKENDIICLSDNEKRVLLQIFKKANIKNEKVIMPKVDDLSKPNVLKHEAARTNIQDINVCDVITSHNNNKYSECHSIIEKKEIIEDENYFLKREQLATQWVHSYLQKLKNTNDDI